MSLVRRLDLTSLQLFVAICDEGTLTRAAEKEAIATSALSKRLSDLEHALQAKLFYRQAKGMTLTPAGETLLHYARSMLQSVANLGAEIGEHTEGARGHVRILANISAIVEFLPDDLRLFFTNHSQVKIELEERLSTGVLRGVHEGVGDIGICIANEESGDLLTLPYRRDRLVLAVPETHPLAKHDRIAFEDSLAFDHISFHNDSAIHARLRFAAAQVGKTIKLRIQAPGFDSMCRMVDNGLGVALMPDRAFEAVANTQGIKAVSLSDEWAARELKIVIRDEAKLSSASRLLIAHLERYGAASRRVAKSPFEVTWSRQTRTC